MILLLSVVEKSNNCGHVSFGFRQKITLQFWHFLINYTYYLPLLSVFLYSLSYTSEKLRSVAEIKQ